MAEVGDSRHGSGPALSATENRRAIAAMVVSTLLYTLSDAAMKLVSAGMPIGEAVFLRSIGAVILLANIAAMWGLLASVRRVFVPTMIWRSLGDAGNSLTFQAALSRIPLADAMGVLQLAPLSLTAASALLLGAKVGWRRWLAVAAGFAGALLVIKPGTDGFNIWGGLVILSVLCGTARDISTRWFDATISPVVILLVSQAGVGIVALVASVMFETWTQPTLLQLGQIGVASFFIATGHIALIEAVRRSEIAAVAPFRYSGILWGLLIGFLLWRHIPDGLSLCGMTILMLAGIYSLHRERGVSRTGIR